MSKQKDTWKGYVCVKVYSRSKHKMGLGATESHGYTDREVAVVEKERNHFSAVKPFKGHSIQF